MPGVVHSSLLSVGSSTGSVSQFQPWTPAGRVRSCSGPHFLPPSSRRAPSSWPPRCCHRVRPSFRLISLPPDASSPSQPGHPLFRRTPRRSGSALQQRPPARGRRSMPQAHGGRSTPQAGGGRSTPQAGGGRSTRQARGPPSSVLAPEVLRLSDLVAHSQPTGQVRLRTGAPGRLSPPVPRGPPGLSSAWTGWSARLRQRPGCVGSGRCSPGHR